MKSFIDRIIDVLEKAHIVVVEYEEQEGDGCRE